MAQKKKVHAKTVTAKRPASAVKTKPATKSASAKPQAAKKSVVAAKKPVTKSPSKGLEMKKTPAAASAGKKPALKPVAAAAHPAQPKAAAPKAAAPVARAPERTHTPVSPARAAAALAKAPSQKLTAPVPAPAAPAVSPKAIAEKAAAARQAATTAAAAAAAQKKPVNSRHGFKTNEFIVYPAHGVGRIVGIEDQEIAGMSLELFVITFDKEKLTLRVPTGKLESVGMRKLADEGIVKKAMETLKGRARVKRTMWSRRAQEYVAKINSGDLVSIAEVVRDLYRSEAQPEQSYSERQLYEDALDRMAREIAAVEKLDDRGAVQRITEVLSKSARGRRMAEGADAPAAAEAVKAA
jgi:CarD family transcriptional regulator, regulator of rRNA transcription